MAKSVKEAPILFGSEARQFVAPPPLSDSVMVRIPKEYQSHSLEIIIVPIADGATLRNHGLPVSSQRAAPEDRDAPAAEKVPLFGALKGKINYIAPDFDEPLEDFAEYM